MCACVSKGITCWGCFTDVLDTEIAGRSLKDLSSGRSLNQTLQGGCGTNPCPAAPAAPASTGAVSGLAYPRIEPLSQHITKITTLQENPCRLQGFRVCTAVMCMPFHHSCLLVTLRVFFLTQSRRCSRYSSEMSKQRQCVLFTWLEKLITMEMSWKSRLYAWIIHGVIHSLIMTYCNCPTGGLWSLTLVRYSWKSDGLAAAVLHLEK